jgi:methyl-accepting chemotaxis protein-1 (serine sensor receptor)
VFKNVTVKARLIGALGLLGFLLFAGAAMGLFGLHLMNGSLRSVYEDRMVPVVQLDTIARAILRNRIAIVNSVANPTPEEIRRNTADVEQGIELISRTWDAYMATYLTPEEKKLAEKFIAQRKKFVAEGLSPAVELLRAGKIDAARKHVFAVIEPAYAPVREGIDALIKLQADVARQEYESAESMYRTISVVAMLGVLFGLALAAISGYLLVRAIVGAINQAVAVAEAIAGGDLTRTVTVDSNDELGKLLGALKGMSEKLVDVVSNVRNGSISIATASKQIAEGNTDLSQRTQEQASALEETASSMEEMTSTVRQNADNARQANQLVASARTQAQSGGEVVTRAVAAMEAINSSSKKIADIISVIDEIAFQTNLLALNAAVEAARAGEQGRGFAVVATEVRNLAQRSATAAKEIKELINDSVDKVKTGSELVDASGQALSEIVESVKKVTDIVAEIAAASQEQSSGIEQVNKAVMQMDEMTQQNAALVEEAAAASKSMEEQASRMTEIVAFFRSGGDERPKPRKPSLPEKVAAATGGKEKGNGHGEPEKKPAVRVVVPARAGLQAKTAAAPAAVPKKAAAEGEWEEF